MGLSLKHFKLTHYPRPGPVSAAVPVIERFGEEGFSTVSKPELPKSILIFKKYVAKPFR